MEFLIFMFILWLLGFIVESFETYTSKTSKSVNKQSRNNSKVVQSSKRYLEVFDADIIEDKKESYSQTTPVNNYYVQNNYYIQQNNYSKSKSADENKDHTAKVWKRLGYRVKAGKSYAYKFYGKEIYKPDQVELDSTYSIKYSKEGLAKKLLRNTGSKSMAKDILVKEYGVSEYEAKNLVGYRPYTALEIQNLDI